MAAKIPLPNPEAWEKRKEKKLLNCGIFIQYGKINLGFWEYLFRPASLVPEGLLTSPYSSAEPVSFFTHFVSKDIDGRVALATLNASPIEIKRIINQFFIKLNLSVRELGLAKINCGTIRKFWFFQVLFAWLEPGQKVVLPWDRIKSHLNLIKW